ncbi:tetraketide alpha-pyrone reductase 2-like isoform X2 [Carex rostrata]
MKYCVTGGTGFIASHIIKTLLVKGHTVRATVRDPDDGSKVQFLWDMEGAKEKLELVKADLTVDGSFDQAVDGVDGVFHTASPVLSNQQNIQETLIDPAIKGTRNVLISCAKASSVRRVVLTSSCSAVRYRDDATIASPLGESHWSDPDYCRRYNLWYAYAKTIAEKEAWRLAKEMEIELVVVNPSFVIGPLLAPNPSSTLAITFAVLKGVGIKEEMTNHIAWIPTRSENWGFLVSPQLSRCLMIASRASKRTSCFKNILQKKNLNNLLIIDISKISS